MTTKYLSDGREVDVIEKLSSGMYLVDPLAEYNYDNETYTEPSGALEMVSKIFDKPPTFKADERVSELKVEEARLINAIGDKRRDMLEAERLEKKQAEERKKKFNKYPALRNLELLIDGKIQYLVIHEYSTPVIKKPEEALKVADGDRGELRMMSLYGNEKRRFKSWQLHQYSDGSGSQRKNVIPVQTYEEAITYCQDWLNKEAEELREAKNIHFTLSRLVEFADKYELSFPDDLRDIHYKKIEEVRQKKLAELQESIDKAKGEIKELKRQ